MTFFRMCRAYLTTMCEFWARDTSYKSSNCCRTTYLQKSKPALCAVRIHQQDMKMEPQQLIQDVSIRCNITT